MITRRRSAMSILVTLALLAIGPLGAFLDSTSSLHYRTTWLMPTLVVLNALGSGLGTWLKPKKLYVWPLLATPIMWLELIWGFPAVRLPIAVYLGGLAGGLVARRIARSSVEARINHVGEP